MLSPEGTEPGPPSFPRVPLGLHPGPPPLSWGPPVCGIPFLPQVEPEWWGQGHRRQERAMWLELPKPPSPPSPRGVWGGWGVPGQSLPLSLLCHAGNSLKANSSQGDGPQTKERTDGGLPWALKSPTRSGLPGPLLLPHIIWGSSRRGRP